MDLNGNQGLNSIISHNKMNCHLLTSIPEALRAEIVIHISLTLQANLNLIVKKIPLNSTETVN